MSKVSISGDNQGNGTFTIRAPNSDTDRIFDLPDQAGIVLTGNSDLEPQVKTSLNATGDAPMFACRAFCNFNGTGTVSIRESGNVSSITDINVGEYQVNFETEMPDSNYSVLATAEQVSFTDIQSNSNVTSNSVVIFTRDTSSTRTNREIVCVAVFR